MELIILIAVWIFLDLNFACHGTVFPALRIHYTRDQLLAWNTPSLPGGRCLLSRLPDAVLRRENSNSTPGENAGKVKKRNRGKKGGVRQRLRRKQLTRIPLPSMILGNTQSLRNKLDELQGNVRFLQEYRNSCIMAFTESWLTDQDLDSGLWIDGFGIPLRTDRSAEITVMISSATDEVKNLTGTEGGSITLPDPVVELGFFYFNGKVFATVTERKLTVFDGIYKNRLLFNENTGLFTLSGLQRNDSGIYSIDSKKGRVFFTSYKLTVFESVPTPAVSVTSVSADSCTLLCLVEKAEETALLWYRDEEIVNQSSSALSLPLTVHKQDFSSSYRCVAANPAEKKTSPVNVTTSCSGQDDMKTETDTDTRHHVIGITITIVAAVLLILVVCNIKWKYFDKTTRKTHGRPLPPNPQAGWRLPCETSSCVAVALYGESLSKTPVLHSSTRLLKDAPPTFRGSGQSAPGFRGSCDVV